MTAATFRTRAPLGIGPLRHWRLLAAWAQRNSLSLYAGILILLLALLAVAPLSIIAVPAGSVGVLWKRFDGGTVTDRVLGEGTHLIAPWNLVFNYDTRLRTLTRNYDAVTANGLAVEVGVALRYRVNPPAAGLVHKLAGPHYIDTLVQPRIANLLYEFVSQRQPDDFYSLNRGEIQAFLQQRLRAAFPLPTAARPAVPPSDDEVLDGEGIPLIRMEDILVSSITLPAAVREAIEHKAQQQQIMQEYDYRLQREAKERDRKRIEAEGIRDFQQTVSNTITPEYLRLRGIEATQAFAASSNAKTIIIGGKDGLPVILNTADDSRAASPVAPSSAAGDAAGEHR